MSKQDYVNKFHNLTPQQQEKLLNRLKELNKSPVDIPIFPSSLDKETTELSFGQERLWFLYMMDPNSGSYTLNRCLHLEGFLSIDALRISINILMKRHEVLRTSIHKVDGKPLNFIAKDIPIPFEVKSLKGIPKNEVESIVSYHASHRFDIQIAPLFRVYLFEIAENENILLISIHHIISDGWSIDLFLEELVYNYNATIQEQQLISALPSIHYSDYVAWQKRWFQDDLLKSSLNFWRTSLKDAPKLSIFPYDFQPTAQQIEKGHQLEFSLEFDLCQTINKFCQNFKITPFNLFLSILNVLLYRYTGNNRFVIGTPVSGRIRPELSKMIGLLINTLPLNNNLDSGEKFTEFLSKVSKNSLEAFDHQLVPFEKILQIVQTERDFYNSPLFQILFIFNEGRNENLKLEKINWNALHITQNSAKYSITFEVIELENYFKINIEYNSNLYKLTTIQKIIDHYLNLIKSVIRDPEKKIKDFSILSVEEEKIYAELNQTELEISDKPIHSLIFETCQKYSDQIAVEYKDDVLTYSQLEEQSLKLAQFLVRKGVKNGDRIGVFMNPGIELIPCLIGVLAAGCCYVPLDPSVPLKRSKLILEETQVKFIVQEDKNIANFLGEETEYINFHDALNFDQTSFLPEVSPFDLAYIIFTSGSTGKPKGIMIEHKNVINALTAFKNILNIQTKDLWLSATTFSFDISVLEFFLPLLIGARIRIVDKLIIQDVDKLINEINLVKPTIIQGTPSLWQLLMKKKWKPEWNISILCGGESMSSRLASQLLQISQNVFNVYGPTETTIWVTYHRLSPYDENILIGRPISNTQIFILDSNLSTVPINVVGDVYIGGLGVGRGYLNRPDLQNQNFIKIPQTQQIVYASKDRAKLTESGAIQFIGRSDHQLKIRGFRVEPFEIEYTLESHEEIQKSIVSVRPDSEGNNELVVFIQLKSNNKIIDLSTFQTFLKERLPSYMLPSKWKIMDQFPLLPNGKIDQDALSRLTFDFVGNASNYAPAITEVQLLLQTIWEDNLKIKNFGIHDNYFDLGGHSILAVRLIDEINYRLKTGVSLKTLFLFPTIAGLEEWLKSNSLIFKKVLSFNNVVTPNIKNANDPFPLTDVQMAYLMGKNSAFGTPNISSHLYREIQVENFDLSRFEKVINELIQRHPALRIISENGMQRVLETVPYYKIQITDLSKLDQTASSDEFEKIRYRMSHQIFDEQFWPLFEVHLVRLEYYDTIHLSFSLLTIDAASLEILFKELNELYHDPEKLLPPISLTFRDCVMHAKNIEFSIEYQVSKEYWQKRIKTFASGPQLPLQPLVELERTHVTRYEECLEKENWIKLKTLSRKIGVTPSCFLIVAFTSILRKWTRDPNFSIVLTLFNRFLSHPEINLIVGDFTTVSLLEIPKENFSFIDLAKQCQEQLFNDLDHRFYNGIHFTQDLLRENILSKPIPVVFTSLLEQNLIFPPISSQLMQHSKRSFSLTQTPQVILDHQVLEREERLYLSWDVVEEMFPENLISTMFNSYINFLKKLANFDSIDAILLPTFDDLVKPEAMKTMLENRKRRKAWDLPMLLHEGIVEQARISPYKIAVVQGQNHITYDELVREAYKIENALKKEKIARESLIGIWLDKSWQQIAALLGILMHGCAYVPLDTFLPMARILELINESECSCLIVKSHEHSFSNLKQISIDEITNVSDEHNEPSIPISPTQLAYVIYTSGSTGKPKGVAIEHQAAMNTIHTVNQHLKVTENDAIYGISALGFDLSVYDIFGLLSRGGKLILPEMSALRDPSQWLSDIKSQNITLWSSVPAFVSMLAEHMKGREDRIENFQSLRVMMMSGESIPVFLPSIVYSMHNSIKIMSLGGATEASIWSIWYDIPRDAQFQTSIPYGTSMDNQFILVLNDSHEEKPIWSEGELYIGGQGVARGYWNNPSQTNIQFLNHPQFGKIFKTYDLGKYQSNGLIEFLGRTDRQVKVGGFRIELAEIEEKINNISLINKSVVIALDKGNHQKELHGFITFREEDLVDLSQHEHSPFLEIQKHIRKDLETRETLKINFSDNSSPQTFFQRKSDRIFANKPLILDDFANWLSCLKQVKINKYPFIKALYGSARDLYPVQIYVYVKENKILGLTKGNYYYHPINNQLIKINDKEIKTEIFAPNNHSMINESAFLMFLVADLSIIEAIYPMEAKLFCYIEAGLITQLLELQSINTNIGLCQVGRTAFEEIAAFFELSSTSMYIHGIVGGYVALNKKTETVEELMALKKLKFPPLSSNEILNNLKLKLPAYMVPASLTILPEIPLTSNGKINYKALTPITEEKKHQIPQTTLGKSELYETLVSAWQKILGVPEIKDYETSFFDLGGNSLKLVLLHNELETTFNTNIPIVDLFRFSTIKNQIDYFKNRFDAESITQKSKLRAQLREKTLNKR